MKKLLPLIGLLLLATPAAAADNALVVTPGLGVTMRTIDVGGLVQAGTSVPVGTNGASAWGTAGAANANVLTVQGILSMTPFLVTLTGTNNIATVSTLTSITNAVTVAQPTAANLNATVIGTGTFAVQAAPSTAAAWGLGATGAGVPANALYNGMNVGGTLTGLTGTGTSLNVNCTAGCTGAGGTSSNFGSGFPAAGTAIGMSDGTNMVATRATAYGTAPTGLNAMAVNAFVTNANANGRVVSGSSSPVVPSSAPTTLHFIAANSTNANFAKASAATLMSCQMSNNSTTAGYLKIFNKASAPTMGTDVPVVTAIIPGPAAGGGGSNIQFGPGGLALSLGFAYAVTGGIGDLDTTAVAAATFAINCQYD